MEKIFCIVCIYLICVALLVYFEEKGSLDSSTFLSIFFECSGSLWTLISIYTVFFTSTPIYIKICIPLLGLILLLYSPWWYIQNGQVLPKRLKEYRDKFFA